ncbi:MAG: ADP-glyceromanno-heptose 6-epimerase [Bacteroidales bacterium]|nr:ADP-glyceromanno-heptose 6-epimerase [Bacteroidales bacterium]
MIIVTGAAGFIGSCLISGLLEKGYKNIIAVDDFSKTGKAGNLEGKQIYEKIGRSTFLQWLDKNGHKVQFIFHIGARTDTTEFNMAIFDELNTGYSQKVWDLATLFQIPVVYASSAATYGLGELGYADNHDIVQNLQPLNPYGISKNEFDKWVLDQDVTPPFWAGMKFFNVYGPNEYHKGRMASVIFHAYRQIKDTGSVKLFRSHRPDFEDGMQLRDFVYVKDVVAVLIFMMEKQPEPGLYNLGTGKARSFVDLALATFKASDVEPAIGFVDTPADIRDKYQYFTEAEMLKLRNAGYKAEFTSLEEGVSDYVRNYLSKKNYL